MPRIEHTFAEESGLAAFWRPRRTGAGKKEGTRHLYFFSLTGQDRSATWACLHPLKCWECCLQSLLLSMGPNCSFLLMFARHRGGTRRRQRPRSSGRPCGSVVTLFLDLLSGLMQVIPRSISASIICITHLTDAKKVKELVCVPVIKGEKLNYKAVVTYQTIIRPKPKSKPKQALISSQSMERRIQCQTF